MTTAVEPKKFAIDYQIEDDNGQPIGPPQHFEADTQKELLDLVKNAHRSAAKEMYKEKKARKIGDLITPDPEKPIQKFERRQLTADERTRLVAAAKDPQTGPEATRTIIEAELGAPIDDIRESLQYIEIRRRIDQAQQQTDLFLNDHPEYVQCSSNQEMILKWLEKRHFAITRKNLELAYEDLGDMLTTRAPERAAPAVPASEPLAEPTPQVSTSATTVESIPAPPQSAEIPPTVTPAPAITEQPAEVRPRTSSSGLGRDNASASPGAEPPKVQGITMAQIIRMNSNEYLAFRSNPANKEIVKMIDAGTLR